MGIFVQYIHHSLQRYDTCGDWWFDEHGSLQVRVSMMDDKRSMEAVALHEIIEALLCRAHGVPEEEVSRFDKQYEAMRTPHDTSEPGDEPDAPYHVEHRAATLIEKKYLSHLGVSWKEHTETVNNLPDWNPAG